MDQLSKEELETLISLKNEIDKAALKLEAASSNYNLQNMNYKYFILSLYRKYNLNDGDKIDDAGIFIKKVQE